MTPTIPFRTSVSSQLTIAAVCFALIGSAVTIVGGDTTPAVVGLGSALALLESALLITRAHGFTATVIPVIVVNAVMLSGLVFWPIVANNAIVSVRLGIDPDGLDRAASYGIMFTAAFTAGALLVGMGGVERISLSGLANVRLPSGWLVTGSFVVLGIVAVGYGSALFQGQYLGGAGPEAAIIAGNALTPLAVIAVCISAFRPGKFRSLAVIGIVLWTIALFGRASRTLATLPVFILLGWLLSTRRRLRWWHVIITAIATIFLLQLPLALRANADGVGIFTLGEAFLSDPESVFAQFDPAGVFGNLLFSAPLTGLVGLREVPGDALWVSLTPIGGSAAGWDSLAPALKVDGSTPYSTLGELAAHGTLELLAVPFFVGMVFALAERVASSLPGVMASAGQLVILAIIALYSVRILQYNLRTTTRLIWYMAAGLAAVWLVSLLFRHRAPRREKRVQNAAGESAPL